jgi:hypothetical protein
MDAQRTAPAVGIVACLLVLVVALAPSVLVGEPPVGAYYAAGPTGLSAVGFLGVFGAVAFLAGRQGRTEPDLAAGVALVLGATTLAVAVVWFLAVDETLLFSFPAEYAWIEWHRLAVPVVAATLPVVAGVYAWTVLAAR